MTTTDTETAAEVVGATVRAELARKRVSQVTVGAHLHLSQTAVSRRLTGKKAFDVDELAVIARLVEVPLSRLVAA